MPAANKDFPWLSHYGNYKFFESRMKEHAGVAEIKSVGTGVYEILRASGDVLKIFICECYCYGVAEYLESQEKLGSLNTVIINSNWCGYTQEAKNYCKDKKVGLFSIAQFMGAINQTDFWNYMDKDEREAAKRAAKDA